MLGLEVLKKGLNLNLRFFARKKWSNILVKRCIILFHALTFLDLINWIIFAALPVNSIKFYLF